MALKILRILDGVKSYDDACATPGELVKLIHFNVEHPENRNLVMNDDANTCIFDGKNWKVIDKDTFHNAVVDRAFNMITNYYERRRDLYKLKNNLLRVQYELGILIYPLNQYYVLIILKNHQIKI